MLLITWCSRDSSTPKFLPGEDQPHASYDPILVALSFSDNNQLPSTHLLSNTVCGTQCSGPHCIRIQLTTCINTLKYMHLHSKHTSFSIQRNILSWTKLLERCRVRNVIAAFHNLMRGEGGRGKKTSETHDPQRLVVILTGTSEFNLGLLITSFPTESAERMNNILCCSVEMNMVPQQKNKQNKKQWSLYVGVNGVAFNIAYSAQSLFHNKTGHQKQCNMVSLCRVFGPWCITQVLDCTFFLPLCETGNGMLYLCAGLKGTHRSPSHCPSLRWACCPWWQADGGVPGPGLSLPLTSRGVMLTLVVGGSMKADSWLLADGYHYWLTKCKYISLPIHLFLFFFLQLQPSECVSKV